MKYRLKKVLSTLLLAGVLVTSTVPAMAGSANVAGGVWSYGTSIAGINKKKVYSNFFHSSNSHRSSVTIDTQYVNSGWVEKGKTSYASAIGTWGAATHAYYDCK